MTEGFPSLCLAPSWYFPLAGQFFIFSANATLHTVSIYPAACLSKHHSTRPAPTGIDFHLSRDYVWHFDMTTSRSGGGMYGYSDVPLHFCVCRFTLVTSV